MPARRAQSADDIPVFLSLFLFPEEFTNFRHQQVGNLGNLRGVRVRLMHFWWKGFGHTV